MTLVWIAKAFGWNTRVRPKTTSKRRTRPVRPGVEEMEHRLTPALTTTWVSGLGDDSLTGDRTEPNRTFAGAISHVEESGVIRAVDPGGYGAVTITKSVTIDGSGTHASILSIGTHGIHIAAGADDIVILRNLSLTGVGVGSKGINIISAAEVHIENCVIENFTGIGVDFAPTNAGARLFITNSTVLDNAGGGVVIRPSGVPASAAIDRLDAFANPFGVQVQDGANVSISNSNASGNTTYGFGVTAASAASTVDLVDIVACNNGDYGVYVEGASSIVTHHGLVASGNGDGGAHATSGRLDVSGENLLVDNEVDFTPITLNQRAGAGGGASRTWVSPVGDNDNPGSRTSPVQTFAGALAKTALGGEISVLDPGSFGPVSIDQSLVIDGAAALAAISVFSGDGITIDLSAAGNGVVILRNLTLNGINQQGANGINIIAAGAVYIDDCVIKNFLDYGINFVPTTEEAQLFVTDTTFINNGEAGIRIAGDATAGNVVRAVLDRVQFFECYFGITVNGNAHVTAVNSVVSGSHGNGVHVTIPGEDQPSTVTLAHSVVSHNGLNGIYAEGDSAATVNIFEVFATGNSNSGADDGTGGQIVIYAGTLRVAGNHSFFTSTVHTPTTGGGATRGWVATTGNDLNPASRTAPVQTFAGALAKTTPGGEINVLDSGDFGPVVINKAITIDGGAELAAISAGAGASAIVINAGGNDVVILRNLRLNGMGLGGAGIHIQQAAAVIIENCVIENFTLAGILFAAPNAGTSLYVHNTWIGNNGAGIVLHPLAEDTIVSIDNVQLLGNGVGLSAGNNADATISDSLVSGSFGNGIEAIAEAGPAFLHLESVDVSNNGGYGIFAFGSDTDIAASNVTAFGNSDHATASARGAFFTSYGNNHFADNDKGFEPVTVDLGTTAPSRAWVSGLGNDANPADRTTPDLTFQGADEHADAGGEINPIDAGDFGPLTITHSITIDGGNGPAAILTTAGGQSAIVIDAGPDDVVILRGLTLDGFGVGTFGIYIIQAGAVFIDDCVIANFAGTGIVLGASDRAAKVFVTRTIFSNNGAGFSAASNSHSLIALDRVQAEGNSFGLVVGTGASAAFSNSHVAGGTSHGIMAVVADSETVSSVLMLRNVISTLSQENGVWVQGPVNGSSTVSATVIASKVVAMNNRGAGFNVLSSSPVDSFLLGFGDSFAFDNLSGSLLPGNTPPSVVHATVVASGGTTLGGNVTADNGPAVIRRGVVYSLTSDSQDPERGGPHVTDVFTTGGVGVFIVEAPGLIPGASYTFAAYAVSRDGISFSEPATFVAPTSHAQFAAAGQTVDQAAGTFSITITLSAAEASDVSIPFTLGGTALAGVDFALDAASPLVIPAGETSAVLTGTIVNHGFYGDTGDKTLIVTLGAPTGAGLGTPGVHTLTLRAISDRPSYPGLSPEERAIQALYLDELGREASQGEIDAWVTVLNGPGGFSEVIRGIQESNEALTRQVKSWYQEFLGRPAGPGEEQGWVNDLAAGAKEEEVLAGILTSQEFFNRAQTLQTSGDSVQRYVETLFKELLQRTPTAPEMLVWTDQMATIGRAGVVRGFLYSSEFRTRVIAGYYNALLHRPADPDGLALWVESGLDLNAIRAAIEASAEFQLNG